MSGAVIVIADVGSMSGSPYLRKLSQVLDDAGIDFEHWGWERHPGKTVPSDRTRLLLRGGGEVNRKLAFWYPVWMLRVLLAALRRGPGPLYFCSRFTSALPLACAGLVRRVDYVYADRDNVAKSYRWPGPFRWLFAALERFAGRRARLHLVPGTSRIDRPRDNVRVIANTPHTQVLEAAQRMARAEGYTRRDDGLDVYVNGWLPATRGLAMILGTARALADDPRIRFVVAGTPGCPEAQALVELPNVEHHGRLSNEQALALYFRTHLVLTFYDPGIEINRLAEPNKWWDCIATGTPFIVNREVETAVDYIARGLCLAIDYGDAAGLAAMLAGLADDRARLDALFAAVAQTDFVAWDDRMVHVLAECGVTGVPVGTANRPGPT